MKNNLAKDVRHSRGMTQVEFAAALGVTVPALSAAENSDTISERLKANILRTFPLDDAFFKYVEQKKLLNSYK